MALVMIKYDLEFREGRRNERRRLEYETTTRV